MGAGESKLTKPSVHLSKREKELLQISWSNHVHKDEGIGGKVFNKFFNDSPEAKDSFGIFDDIQVDDQHYNEVLHRHGSRVKRAVGTVIESINDPHEYKAFLIKLGYRHFKEYKFDPKYIQVILEYFLMAIKDTVHDDWDQEIETAYMNLFSIITFYLVNSLNLKKNGE